MMKKELLLLALLLVGLVGNLSAGFNPRVVEIKVRRQGTTNWRTGPISVQQGTTVEIMPKFGDGTETPTCKLQMWRNDTWPNPDNKIGTEQTVTAGTNYAWSTTAIACDDYYAKAQADENAPDWVQGPMIYVIDVDGIDGYVYGESGRKIANMDWAATGTSNVVSSGYVKFKARFDPSAFDGNYYYKWSTTAGGGTLTGAEGSGDNYLDVKWDAPNGHETGVTITFEVKESAAGDVVCTRTIPLMTVRPYVIGVKFEDDSFLDEEQDITGNPDIEWDATRPAATRAYPICYVKNKGMQVELDIAGQPCLNGDGTSDADNDLTAATPISIAATASYGGLTNAFDSDTIDANTVDWSHDDYTEIQIESNDNLPNVVREYEDFDMLWTFQVKNSSGTWVDVHTQTTAHRETLGGRTYGLYTTYDNHEFADPNAGLEKIVLDYGCSWADGRSTEEPVITDLLTNGFAAHYTWVGDCYLLAADFMRLCLTLGIEAENHFWGASQYTTTTWNFPPYDLPPAHPYVVNDMLAMRTIVITPVGRAAGRQVWGFHQWAFANGKTRDPSAGTTFNGDWRDYEDHLFEGSGPGDVPPGPGGYLRVTAVDALGNVSATAWEGNHAGQNHRCEANATSGSGSFRPWRGPDR